MPRAKPRQPRANTAHPLYRGHEGLWALTPHGVGPADLAGRSAPGTLIGAGATWRGTSVEGPGLDLNGTAGYANCGTASGTAAARAMTVWARLILRTPKAAGTAGGLVAQWNDGVVNYNRQQFILQQVNGMTRPANSLDFSINTNDNSPGSYVSVNVQFQAGDVGRPWTVVGVYDGSSVRIHAFLPSGYVTASAAKTGQLASIQSSTFLGNVDGGYLDMILLAAGVVRGRAWNAQEVARHHADPYALFRPAVASAVTPAAAPAVAPRAYHHRRRRRAG